MKPADDLDRLMRCCCCWLRSRPRRRRNCAAMAGRCARWRFRPTARTPFPAASTPRRSAGRSTRNVAEQVMRFHDSAVNAVAWLKDGRIVTAGADAHIAIWTPGKPEPDTVLDGHSGPIAGLAVSPRRRDARLGVLGSHRAAVAACRRRAARAGRQRAERQRRRVHARRPRAGERRLRRDAAHLAARRRRRRAFTICRRRSIRWRSRPTARSSRPAPTARSISCRRRASCAATCRRRRRRSSRSRSRPTASWSPPPASAARWR